MTVLIVLAPNFRDEEFAILKKKLHREDISVVVAGLQAGEVRGFLGMVVVPDILLDSAKTDDYEAIILPGGEGSIKHLWNDPKILSFVKEASDKGKVVAASSLSCVVLANAGILCGKNATVFETPEAIKIFAEKGVNHMQLPTVVDGRIVTADGSQSAARFADDIIRLLKLLRLLTGAQFLNVPSGC